MKRVTDFIVQIYAAGHDPELPKDATEIKSLQHCLVNLLKIDARSEFVLWFYQNRPRGSACIVALEWIVDQAVTGCIFGSTRIHSTNDIEVPQNKLKCAPVFGK